MTKIGKFHSPYMPNDGHGPGVPLPEKLHRWLCTLNGMEFPVDAVIASVIEATDDEPYIYRGEDHGDYIAIVGYDFGEKFPSHHWMGIKYDEVKDAV